MKILPTLILLLGSLCVASAATFIVTNTNDSGLGSLRQAMLDAEAAPDADVIAFNIPGAGPHTIDPLTQFPTNTHPVLIDGYTQPGASANTLSNGFNAVIKIRIVGTSNGSFQPTGFRLQTGTTIRGLAIFMQSQRTGIQFIAGGSSNTVAGCLLGINIDGTVVGNGPSQRASTGLHIKDSSGNQIGGLTPADRNVISYNFSHGVFIEGTSASNNVVRGNFIGTDFNGTAIRANFGNGVEVQDAPGNLIGGLEPGARNLISGNSSGVRIRGFGSARGNVIQGNFIGVNVTGTAALANTADGIVIDSAQGTIIGGSTAGAGNVISGNANFGINISTTTSTGSIIKGNSIGAGSTGAALGNGGSFGPAGIAVAGNSNLIGGVLAGEANVIAFNRGSGVIIYAGTQNQIRGNTIHSNNTTFPPWPGIDLGNDKITANDIGDSDTGANNKQNFPLLTSASGNGVTTTVQGTLNSIASETYQLDFFGNTTCDPSGNGEGQYYLGSVAVLTDVSGNGVFNTELPVASPGQFITATATDPFGNTSEFSPCFQATIAVPPMTFTVVSTNDSGAGSLRQAILDSNAHLSSQNNTVAFNISGAGMQTIKLATALPTFVRPVTIDGFTQPGASANTLTNGNNANWLIELDGSLAGANQDGVRLNIENLVVRGLKISRFSSEGIEITSSNAVVLGNNISSNSSGGIYINAANGNRIGGTAPADRNVISGNNGSTGVDIFFSNGNLVLGNFIGTEASGTAALGNQFKGVDITTDSSGNIIGGVAPGAANWIAFHSSAGLSIQGGTNNPVRGNHFFSNGGLGIDLYSSGVTANDVGDEDTGPNQIQNFPILTNAVIHVSSTLVQGTFNSQPNTSYTLDFYSSAACDSSGNGEGEFYLGNGNVTTDGSGNGTFSITLPTVAPKRVLTATATDPDGNTSEFSPCFQAGSTIPPETFTVVNTNDNGPGSLRQALLDASEVITASPHLISFNIPGSGVRTIPLASGLPSTVEPVEIDGYTQPGAIANSAAEGDNAVRLIRLTNTVAGIRAITFQSPGNRVRGLEIHGVAFGIEIFSDNNVVQGNFIAECAGDGIVVDGGIDNLIGGSTPDARNILSGNGGLGIEIQGATASGNKVQGNLIGTDATGLNALPNGSGGVRISGSPLNTIGGASSHMRNVISGNSGHGIDLSSSTSVSNRIYANLIGILPNGTGLGNSGHGINIGSNVRFTVIGEPRDAIPLPGVRNVIAHNQQDGVFVSGGSNNVIRANRIFGNTQLGIDLSPNGVTANDLNDTDTGANFRQNFPLITNANLSATSVTVQGTLQSRPSTSYQLDFYLNTACDPSLNGEGEFYLGSATVTTDASGNAVFNSEITAAATGTFVTATATDPFGNTSEFSPCFQGDFDGAGSFVVTSVADSGPGTMRQAIIDSNNRPNAEPNQISFNIPGPTPHIISPLTPFPKLTQAVIIEGPTVAATKLSARSASGLPIETPQPVIVISGKDLPSGSIGFDFLTSGSTIMRLQLQSFSGSAIRFAGNGNTASGNALGGSTPATGNGAGVTVASGANNVIGGLSSGAGNVVRHNVAGIVLRGNSSVASGNYVGTEFTGLIAQANVNGIIVIGTDSLINENLISANHLGINLGLNADNTVIRKNIFGEGSDGLTELGNLFAAISVNGADDVMIGGSGPTDGNVIAGTGIQVESGNRVNWSGNTFKPGRYARPFELSSSANGIDLSSSLTAFTQSPGEFTITGESDEVLPAGTTAQVYGAFGTGYYYIPGTDTMVQLGAAETWSATFPGEAIAPGATVILTDPSGNSSAFARGIATGIAPTVDLSVTIADGPDPVTVDGRVIHTVTVSNGSLTAAHDVELTYEFHSLAGVLVTAVPSQGGSVTINGDTATCPLGTIPAGATVTVTLTFDPLGVGTSVGLANVVATEPDPVPENNQIFERTEVRPKLGLTHGNGNTVNLTAKGAPHDTVIIDITANLDVEGSFLDFLLANALGLAQAELPINPNARAQFLTGEFKNGFNLCVKDDDGGGDLLVNTETGYLEFPNPLGFGVISGTGQKTVEDGIIVITFEDEFTKMKVRINPATNTATGSVEGVIPLFAGGIPILFHISDSDTTDNNCP